MQHSENETDMKFVITDDNFKGEHIKDIYCEICGNLLFKINIDTYGLQHYGNKDHIRFYGNEKPRLKHIEIITTCNKCKNIKSDIF